MRIIYTLTLFVCSSLLFLVEPMVAKMILPTFGGSPSVWNACVLFFQTVLLLGYLYAHLTTKWLGAKKQTYVHLGLMLIPLLVLPIAIRPWHPQGSANPTLLLLGLLTIMAGAPFFVLSAGAPLLQKWFANTSDPLAKDPYFLYRASNLGSMVALIAYPALYEPNLKLADQSRFWAYGYGFLLVLMALAAITLWKNPRLAPIAEDPEPVVDAPPTNKQRLFWIVLSAVPSSLMLGITTYLTSNLSPIPLLWVIPLALYLLTFVIGFAPKPLISDIWLGRILPLLVTPMAIAMLLEATHPLVTLGILHLLMFTVAALMCHTRLNMSRPSAHHLTEFYLWISVGGMIGGVFNSLVAPVVFKTVAEYPIAIILACFLRPLPQKKGKMLWEFAYPAIVAAVSLSVSIFVGTQQYVNVVHYFQQDPYSWVRTVVAFGVPALLAFFAVDRPLRYASAMGLFFFIATVTRLNSDDTIVLLQRSFFGVSRVRVSDAFVDGIPVKNAFHRYSHGNTLHGTQLFLPEYRTTPLTYYYPTGPIGEVFTMLGPIHRLENVALVGLGTGSLAAYGHPGQILDFYEIDPTVLNIARDSGLLTYVTDSKANINYIMGDARLSLVNAKPHSYDLIVLDAFSSDAIPVHLMTKQALELYISKLKPNGLIAFHISNRYLNLAPIVANICEATGMIGYYDEDDYTKEEGNVGKTASKWTLLGFSKESFGPVLKTHRWSVNPPNHKYPVWTDDYSNILSVLEKN